MKSKSILKSASLLVIAGSLSACGGGGSVTSVAEMINQPVEAVAEFDTNNDGNISIDEALAAWDSLSTEDKELLADAANTTVADINQLISEINSNVDVEIPVEDIIEVIEEVVVEEVIEPTQEELDQAYYDDTFNYYTNNGLTNFQAATLAAIETTHEQGYTGEGISIKVIDGFTATADEFNHGQHVLNNISRIAPGATITDHEGLDGYLAQTIVNTVEDGDIVNLSVGDTTSENWITNLQYFNTVFAAEAVSIGGVTFSSGSQVADALFVVAAGNSGTRCFVSDCNHLAEALDDHAETIVVGSANDEGTGFHIIDSSSIDGIDVDDYSTRAGKLKDSYILAPVVPGYVGTSFAAPVVSGVAALIQDKYDSSPSEIRDIIFSTADDIGAPGVDPIYGHGVLNASAALSPIGSLD